ncbi:MULTISPECIES: hypothetical protein [Methylosinus]|uniref:Uncharacterized protein n=1 Tax=Methylosinus trichosporium (strain ATCC 35070 / NCIMB 11131 / UNIQEM 75 / OB3b) TaxID=595536 RepID=A0A2D2CX57_METT3|nr:MULTISPECIES: hypothetical protein [Methylosinus]ATQ67249.1 hypothetical protein CQW49_04565 [Methylosinus trichosporium OB3b]
MSNDRPPIPHDGVPAKPPQDGDKHPQDALEPAPEESWIEKVEEEIEEVVTQPPPVLFLRVLKIDLPYIIMLTAAFLGIGVATFTGELTPLYWEALAPVYCITCIYAGWRHANSREERVRLVWSQAAHWFAVLLTMYVVYLPQVRDVMNTNAAGLTLMAILALATVLAGIHAEAWQICVVGVVLAVAVPVVAWIQQSALMMTVLVIGVVFAGFVGASLWWTSHTEKRREST